MEMPVKFTVKIGTVGHSLKTTIPMELAECLGLQKGDKISMWEEAGRLIIEKKKL